MPTYKAELSQRFPVYIDGADWTQIKGFVTRYMRYHVPHGKNGVWKPIENGFQKRLGKHTLKLTKLMKCLHLKW